jgi:TRAP-type C4-dicarboxylate transport system substrate-binding protein
MDGKRVIGIGAVLAVALVGCGPSAAAAPSLNKEGGAAQGQRHLTLAIGEGAGDASVFATAVERLSNGSSLVDVKEHWRNGEPTYETGVIQDVMAGKADIGMVGIRAFDTLGIDTFQGLMAPFLIDRFDLEKRVLESPVGRSLLDGLTPAGLIGLGYQLDALRRPIGFTRDFATLADFQGARIGIRASKVSEMTIKALGGVPVVTNPGDPTGLDAIEGGLTTAKDYLSHGATSVTSDLILWTRPYALFVNPKTWAALSPAQQQQLRGAADSSFQASNASVLAFGDEVHGILCNVDFRFVTAGDAARAEILDAVKPVYAELEKSAATKAVIEAVRGMRGTTTAPEGVAPCPGRPAQPTPAGSSPIDGTWTTSFSKEELANSSLLYDAGEINDENWGTLTLTLGDGRFAFKQRNPDALSDTSGSFTIDGDVLTLHGESGENIGEVFTMRWSLFEGTLTLERDPRLGIAPTPLVIKPWTKSG